MKKSILLVLFFLGFSIGKAISQKASQPWCNVGSSSSVDFSRKIIPVNPIIANTSLIDPNGVIVIPVVFHILNDPGKPEQHLSESIINDQINRLNTDFSKQNSDVNQVPPVWSSLASDMKFQFKLACIDPNGTPMTTPGIVYKSIPPNYEFCDVGQPAGILCGDAKLSALNGDDAWPTDTYLNIWVFDMINTPYAGYSAFPWERFFPNIVITIGGNPVSIPRTALDGIMLDYRVVGDPSPSAYHNKGRVLTHEVGHWLGLFHPYQRGLNDDQGYCSVPGDFVGDTPPQYYRSFSCPTFPVTDACSPNYPGIMFMNYMDASQDDCMYFFTTGQKARARAYFSSVPNGGFPETRYPFIQNYFNIKHFATTPYVVQNNTITVTLNNPACLDVSYTFTGPVTILHSNNQQIVFSVPCNTTGTVSVSATGGITLATANYLDTYTFDFVNNSSCTWPKVYDAVEPGAAVKVDNNGNLLCDFLINNMANNLNHNGPVIANSVNTYWIQYNTTTGATNWVGHNDYTAFTMSSGEVQFNEQGTQSTAVYRNATTGAVTPGPNYVPANENIIAEDNGVYVTSHIDNNTFIDQLLVHASPNIHNPITIPAISTYWVSVERTIFDPGTKKLFVNFWYHPFIGNMPQRYFLATYVLNNNQLTNPLYYEINYLVTEINTAGEVFVVDNIGAINRCNYQSNSYIPIGISNNSSYRPIFTAKQTVEDKILATRSNDNFIYCINTLNLSVKKIAANIDPNNQSPFIGGAFFDGSDVYIAGGFSGPAFTIGNQTMPLLGNQSAFVTKFNINNDFTLRPLASKIDAVEKSNGYATDLEGEFTKTRRPAIILTLSPNPAKQTVVLDIKQQNMKQTAPFFVTITDRAGVPLLTRTVRQTISLLDVSRLRPGMYYVTVSTGKGGKTTSSFIKE